MRVFGVTASTSEEEEEEKSNNEASTEHFVQCSTLSIAN